MINCRMAFRIRCELVKDIKGNYKDKFKRLGGEDALKCDDCLSDEIQTSESLPGLSSLGGHKERTGTGQH